MQIPLGGIFYGGENVILYGDKEGVVVDVHVDPYGFDDHLLVKLTDGGERTVLSSHVKKIPHA